MKKHLKVLASAITVMLVATAMLGCKKADTAKDPGTTTPATETQKPDDKAPEAAKVPSGQKLVVWSHFGDGEFAELKNQIKKWADQTGNTVNVVKDNNKFEALLTAAKSPSAPDVMWGLPSDHLGQFEKSGILEEVPAGAIQADEYQSPEMLRAGQVEGKQYALPIFAETYAVFYNKDKFAEFPKTWEDMTAAGKVQWDITNFYFTYGILATNGAYVFKPTATGYDVNDIGLGKVEGYQVLEKLVKDGHVNSSATGDVPKNNFKTGKADFYISGPWDVADIQKAVPNAAVAPIPTIGGNPGKSFMGVQLGYVVKKANRTADQRAAMEDMLKFLSGKDSLAAVGKAGNRLPVKKDIAVEGISQGFATQLANAELMPSVPQMGAVWDPAKQGLTLLLKGDKDAAGTAEYVLNEVTKKVKGVK